MRGKQFESSKKAKEHKKKNTTQTNVDLVDVMHFPAVMAGAFSIIDCQLCPRDARNRIGSGISSSLLIAEELMLASAVHAIGGAPSESIMSITSTRNLDSIKVSFHN